MYKLRKLFRPLLITCIIVSGIFLFMLLDGSTLIAHDVLLKVFTVLVIVAGVCAICDFMTKSAGKCSNCGADLVRTDKIDTQLGPRCYRCSQCGTLVNLDTKKAQKNKSTPAGGSKHRKKHKKKK